MRLSAVLQALSAIRSAVSGRTLGPYVGGFLAAALLLSLASVGVQTWRLASTKEALTKATVALSDPVTKRPWQTEAVIARADLVTCRTNKDAVSAALDRQTQAVKALAAQSDAWVAESRRQLQAARAVGESHRLRAQEVLSETRGQLDACLAADALIIREASR